MDLILEKSTSGMEIKNRQKNMFRAYLYFTLIFLVMAGIVFSQFFIYDKTLLTTDDGYLQWYSVLVKMKSVLTDFFQGKGFSLWIWDTGLGTDWIGNFSLVFCDPFNWLVLLFSRENIDIAYSVICVLKMYAAGISMLVFLFYHKKPRLLCIVGALGYAFCSWTFMGMRHDFFMTQMILFPLMILGVDKVEDRKSPLMLIVSVFISVINSLYFSYMSAIFVAIYVIVRFILSGVRKKDNGRTDVFRTFLAFLSKLGTYIGYALIGGVLLAAPVLFSGLYALMHASSGSGVDFQWLPNIKQLFRFVPAFAGNYDIHANYMVVGMNAVFVAMIPAMVLMCRKKIVSIWMFAVTLIFALFPFLQSVTNGFSYASGRWCYVLCFFYAYAAVECLQSSVTETKGYRKAAAIWFLVIFGLSMAGMLVVKAITPTNLVFVFINLTLAVVAYLFITNGELRRKRKRRYLAGLACISAVLMAYLSFSPNVGTRLDEYMTVGKCYEIYESSSMKAAKEIRDKEFFRVDTVEKLDFKGQNETYTTTPANANLYWEVPSVYSYISTIDKSWCDFNARLGNNSSYFRRVCTNSNDNRSRMDFLMGVRYFLGDSEDMRRGMSQYAGYGFKPAMKKKNVEILESKYKASLGYVYDSALSESEFMKYEPLEREQVLMQGVQLEDEDMSALKQTRQLEKDQIQLDTKTIKCEIKPVLGAYVSSNMIYATQENASIEIIPEEEVEDSEIYLVFRNLRRIPAGPDQLWSMREKAAENLWKSERKVTMETDALAKKIFYNNYLSYTPYGDMSIMVTKGDIRKRLLNVEGDVRAIRDMEDYMVNLGYVQKSSGTISCILNQIGEYRFDSIEIVAVPQNNFDLQAQKLEDNRLRVTDYGDNRVAGTIDTKEGGMLYLSILYNQGWHIYVDGKEADRKYRVNTAFTGVEVPAGNHTIELLYRPAGMRLSFLLFGAGIFAAMLVEILVRRKRRRSA